MKAWKNDSRMLANTATLCMLIAMGGVLAAVLCGCDSEGPTRTPHAPVGPPPPQPLVQASFGGSDLTFWPYVGTTLDSQGSDPVNLIFVGRASPAEVRAALMALDGDRGAAGLPPIEPFTSTWADANGDVQATYAEDGGWVGSVIQLQLGGYGPMRVHLRLFGTAAAFGSEGIWTLDSAHFEMLIPGTADHQVLSWELAEGVVGGDLARSGLLDGAKPSVAVPGINATPGYRQIPAVIYNELPADLRMLIDGPVDNVTEPVPIKTDGSATLLNLADAAGITAGRFTDGFTMTYDMVMPKPFCGTEESAWVRVAGPVEFHKTVDVTADGDYSFAAGYTGELIVTPMDLTSNPPAPAGPSYAAVVSDDQVGWITAQGWEVSSTVERTANRPSGKEHLRVELRLESDGAREALIDASCLPEDDAGSGTYQRGTFLQEDRSS